VFRFFTTSKWAWWAYLGSFVILASIWVQVQIDVMINEWFGEFYDMVQKALGEANSVTMEEYTGGLLSFAKLAAISIVLGLAISFLTSHFLFRWRASMVEWYHSVYDRARTIEGAAQRVQEDTIKFSRILEGLGTELVSSVLILIEYFPLLMGLGAGITIMWFGDWEYGLVTGAFIWAVGGTILMILLAWVLRLVGIEYDLQKKEAAYRKMLVIAEDDGSVRPKTLEELFDDVRSIHYLSYLRYIYLNIGRLAYLQVNVLVAYIFLAPAIVGGMVTLGVMQQIIRAFGRVEGSLQFLFRAWPTIVELASVYKRLREFERQIREAEAADNPASTV
jgi:peptide/bleomycin uptake transporter|tara:strand:- start:9445 stop:10446 length:1002 start_codon:yes stop_codon:yes gene_type:complete